MKVTVAQCDPTVGDVPGNSARITEVWSSSAAAGADLVVFPELFLTGYPPKDLLERAWFLDRVEAAVDELARRTASHPETALLFGAPRRTGEATGKPLYNSAVLAWGGRIVFEQAKSLLPTYDVFDERRYFSPAKAIRTFAFKGQTLAVSVCEDAWNEPELWPGGRLYTIDPIAVQAAAGATLFINISASPFYAGKEELRFKLIQNHIRKHRRPFLFVNQIGGNDELLFDGNSFCLDASGEPVMVGPAFKEDARTIDTSLSGMPGLFMPPGKAESVYEALVLGLRDYMRKCGFAQALIGLSGGIDSSLTCCLARDAAGAENVLAVSMPGPYSSAGSVDDSRRLASSLGIRFLVIPITGIYRAYLDALSGHFKGRAADVTEENIQARVRGNILFAFSNKFGYLVLSTGNKSELAVGYCTLYGDMSGGLAVLNDVPKTLVYELAAHVNRRNEVIPQAVIDKAPSAELKAGQTDQDTLPPYSVLDPILYYYVEELLSTDEIVARGFDRETVRWVTAAVDRNEYKRRQAPPGLKVTTKAFGVGRLMPIAAKWRR